MKLIIDHFNIDGKYVNAEPYGSGHINDTYLVHFRRDDIDVPYILQRINHHVFRNPPELMENMTRVTRHIRRKLEERQVPDLSRRVLEVILTRDGVGYYKDPDGNYWRVLNYIRGTRTFDTLTSTGQAFQAARAFGGFLEMLNDFPGPPLFETIPGFHNGPGRLLDFQNVLDADSHNRAQTARPEIDFVLAHAPMFDVLPELVKEGKIPIRVTHNDTKINNVMVDEKTGEGLCVIDLDTVMPGLSSYDFGDLARTTLSPTDEDERDLSKISVQMPLFEAILKGFLSAAGGVLTRSEREYLVFGIKMMTQIIGMRFLTDYLAGDVYFRIHREGHNLDRCRTQFKLVRSVLGHEDEMNALCLNREDLI